MATDSITLNERRDKWYALNPTGSVYAEHESYGLHRRLNDNPSTDNAVHTYQNPPTAPANSQWWCTSQVWRDRGRVTNSHDNPQDVGFIQSKKRGLYIPPHYYYSDVRYTNIESFHCSHNYYVPPGAGFGLGMTYPIDTYSLDDQARTQAIQRFWASARNRRVVSAGVTLAELKESIGMTAKAVVTIIEIVTWLKKGRFDKAVEALVRFGVPMKPESFRRVRNYSKRDGIPLSKWASNAWLELQFGWLPLLKDIYSVNQKITSEMNGEYFPAITIYGASKTLSGFEASGFAEPGSNYVYYSDTRYQVDYTLTCRFKVNPGVALLQAFGLTNPASVVWELVPFSFVADWFLPIGRYLDNLDALSGLELIHATMYKRSVHTGKVKTQPKYWTGYSLTASSGSVKYERTIIDQIPPDHFELPKLSNLIDGWKLKTSLALLEQRRR